MHSGIIVLSAYVGFAILLEVVAYFIGRQVEIYFPAWSLVAFLAMFLAALGIAWPLAVMVTPKDPVP